MLQNQLQQQSSKVDALQQAQDELRVKFQQELEKRANEWDITRTHIKNLQNQLQILHQTLESQNEMYKTEQSKGYRRIGTLEAECGYLKNEIAQQTELTSVKIRSRMNRIQQNKSDQTLYDNLPWVDAPRNLYDAAAQAAYSTCSSESSESSDNESYGSPMANRRFDYHDGTSSVIRPRSVSLSQNHHSQRNSTGSSCRFCNWSWQQGNLYTNTASLSQPTSDEYLDSQSDMTRDHRPKSLSQEYSPCHESVAYLPRGQNSMPNYRSMPRELERNTNSLSFYRSSSLGSSRVELNQTDCVLKKVVTAHGESYVNCEIIDGMSELYEGKRVVVYRYYQNINEYATVRKLNVIVYKEPRYIANKKPHYVGVELDLPSLL